MKKKLIILAVIFLLIAVGIAYYFIFIKSPVQVEVPDTPSFFPIDNEPGTRPSNAGSDSIKEQFSQGQPRLFKVSADPVSGLTAYREGTSTILIRYTDKATSHIADVNPVTGETLKITNTTIPSIYEAVWSGNQNRLMLRFLDTDQETINTYTAAVVSPRATTSLEATRELQVAFLPQNIDTLAVSPNGQRAFYLVGSYDGGEGFIANIDSSKPASVFTSPIREWQVSWPEENTLLLTTKPSSGIRGTSYFANTKGEMRKVLGDIQGLTALANSSASIVAYSNNTNNLTLRNIKANQDSSTSLQTLPEKCIWSKKEASVLYCAVPNIIPSGKYPDAWYMGKVTFNDSIYKIDATTGNSTLLANLQIAHDAAIDATNLSLSPGEEYLLFVNKKDYSGWSFKINP